MGIHHPCHHFGNNISSKGNCCHPTLLLEIIDKHPQCYTNLGRLNPTSIVYTNRFLLAEKHSIFVTTIHIFAMNILANNHNKYMLQALVIPIAQSVADFTNGKDAQKDD